MTRASTSPEAGTALLREASDRLLATVTTLGDTRGGTAADEPSLLPDWTRGHVLAHVARNADGLVNLLGGEPMYPSDAARGADIERDAHRPLALHIEDLEQTAARLDDAFSRQRGDAWERSLTLHNGMSVPAYSLPFIRSCEVELHHIDLGAGYGVEDLSDAFAETALTHFTRRFSGHPGIEPHLELRTEDGASWHTGAARETARETVVIAGAPAALVGWLTGRGGDTGLWTSSAPPTLPGL